MRKLFLLLATLILLFTGYFSYERFFVLKTFGPTSIAAVAILLVAVIALLVSYLLLGGRHREKVIALWLVCASTLVGYLVLDLGAGYLLITPLSPQLVPDEYRHHKLVPDAWSKFQQPDFSYVQRNNRLGMRGPETPLDKPAGTYRILTLGDSFTMGKGVEDDQTFTHLLGSRLNKRMQNCDARYDRIEMLNGGVDSYAPILSHIYLSRELARLEPDMVLLNLDNSDLIQEAAYRGIARRDSEGRPTAVPGELREDSSSTRIRDWIENNMFVTRLLLFYVNRWMGYRDLTVRGVVTRANAEVVAHTLQGDAENRDQQWADIFDSIGMIRDFAEQNSMRFMLAFYPWAHQVSDTEWRPGRDVFLDSDDQAKADYDLMLMSLARVHHIEAVSLYPAFRQYQGNDALYFKHDPHFTVAGHELMADALSQRLLQPDIVGSWCR